MTAGGDGDGGAAAGPAAAAEGDVAEPVFKKPSGIKIPAVKKRRKYPPKIELKGGANEADIDVFLPAFCRMWAVTLYLR